MVKPTDIIDNFGDAYLGCPNCKDPVYFPMVGNKKPNSCSKCGVVFDWSNDSDGSLWNWHSVDTKLTERDVYGKTIL